MEELAKDEIDRREHRGIAAEILVQVDATSGAVLPEAGVFGEENAGVGLTEPVDALLDIPHDKTILAPVKAVFEQRRKIGPLHIRSILKLIYHQIIYPSTYLFIYKRRIATVNDTIQQFGRIR